jgi:hypothetical protein
MGFNGISNVQVNSPGLTAPNAVSTCASTFGTGSYTGMCGGDEVWKFAVYDHWIPDNEIRLHVLATGT